METNGFLLQVVDLKTYFFSREGTLHAVDGVNFHLRHNEILGIAGESGCGKSVTAQSILRIVPKNGQIVDGQILLDLDGRVVDLTKLNPDGKEIRKIRGKEIAMIFQEPMTSFSPVHTIGNQIIETIVLHQKLSKKAARAQAIELLGKVGMPNPARVIDEYPFNLSGGMRQRAMIAMALSCQPKILIADEPTTAVDVTIQAQVLELMRTLQQELHMSILIITHDLGIIAELTDNVMIMYLGKEVEYGPTAEIFTNPQHPYTRGLLQSIPKLSPGRMGLTPIAGSVPSPYEMPVGCKFHPRCSEFIKGKCDQEEPSVYRTGEQHWVSCFLYKGEP